VQIEEHRKWTRISSLGFGLIDARHELAAFRRAAEGFFEDGDLEAGLGVVWGHDDILKAKIGVRARYQYFLAGQEERDAAQGKKDADQALEGAR
jgi:hypothetical protein